MQWICTRICYRYSTLFNIGDIIESEENQSPHFTLLEGLEELFPPTGRRFLVEGGRITGVWDE